MKLTSIFLYEWRHFTRSPFKYVALLLFLCAAIYGLHNGQSLYKSQTSEIERISQNTEEDRETYLEFYRNNEKGPANRPWIDMSEPFWAVWYTGVHEFKNPSPLMVYNVGQAEQFGFYKKVTFWSSPYDADMAEEISNPERLQSGMLDFNFVVLYLGPLLLLIFLYNIKGAEADNGILPLIEIQSKNIKTWLLARIGFYLLIVLIALLVLMIYGSFLAPVFETYPLGLWTLLFWFCLYVLGWTLVFTLVIAFGHSGIGNTLKMLGLWLVAVFIIPGIVHQWVSISYPANLMTDFIDAQRDERTELFNQPDSIFLQNVINLFPDITDSKVMKDSLKINEAMNDSGSALANELTKQSLIPIEKSHREKNALIARSYWFNPVSFFQNKINRITETHFDDYQEFRARIQDLIDFQIETMVLDIWSDIQVDEQKYIDYINAFNDIKSNP